MKFGLLSVLLLVGLCGCVQNIPVKEDPILNADTKAKALDVEKAYLLFGIHSDVKVEKITIKGENKIQYSPNNLLNKRTYIFVNVPKGKYKFSEVKSGIYTYNLSEAHKLTGYENEKFDWSFSVKNGQINYVGDLEFGLHQHLYGVELVNHASFAYEYITALFENNIPMPIKYTGPGSDSFLEYIYEKRTK